MKQKKKKKRKKMTTEIKFILESGKEIELDLYELLELQQKMDELLRSDEVPELMMSYLYFHKDSLNEL